ncbi:hypothetical protein GIB67_011073 [Kingdonia uniflora]|uniref:Uncharacterized protein n=1 Tax=Kingdonia uniflora TaxID=39325 RepID=A0A7J7L6M3_9MAGN|nr:hypothetical protein GIB67_011073 [Kingdonia uniflora]
MILLIIAGQVGTQRWRSLVASIYPVHMDVKIKNISVVGGADGISPSKMRASLIEMESSFQMLKVCGSFR